MLTSKWSPMKQVVLHRARGDLEGLHGEGADEEREDHRHHDRLEVLWRKTDFLNAISGSGGLLLIPPILAEIGPARPA